MMREPLDEPAIREFGNRLFAALLGGCTCMTKSPDMEHHDPTCHYRLFIESETIIRRLLAEVKYLRVVKP